MTLPPIALALGAYVVVLVLQRIVELALSKRHARVLAARGAVEFGRAHFVVFVILHALFPLVLAVEVLVLGARPPAAWPAWFLLWLAAQALRVWAIASLGTFWNVRVWVVPGTTPIARGAYRFLRHPNYVAVALEFIAAPMMFGAWRTGLTCSALNAVAMLVRIPIEERAITWAAASTTNVRPLHEARSEQPEPKAAHRDERGVS